MLYVHIGKSGDFSGCEDGLRYCLTWRYRCDQR